MRVLEEPKAPKFYRIRCNNDECRALVEATSKELRHERDREGVALVMKCPRCKQETWVSDHPTASNVPTPKIPGSGRDD